MSIRSEPRSFASFAAVTLFAVAALSLALPIPTLALGSEQETATLAWLGCWQPAKHVEGSPGNDRLVCVERDSDSEDLIRTLFVGDRIVARSALFAEDSRRGVRDGGCEGWESASRSTDGRRLYRRSEVSCENGERREFNTVSMIASADRWVEIQMMRFDRHREIAVREYRPVSSNTVRLSGEVPAAVRTARLAAAEALTVADVIEALEHVDPAVVEAMLQERAQGFAVNSETLLRMDDAGVPGGVIDLMVALSFPDYFSVDDGSIAPKEIARAVGYESPWCSRSSFGYGYGSCFPYGHHYFHLDQPAAVPRVRAPPTG